MDALRIERDDDVLRIVLARPETRNAFDAAAIAELAEAFVDVGKARAVVLVGEGPSFCAGADIEWMRQSVVAHPRRERRRRQRAAPDARRDRHLSRAGDRGRPGACDRRRGGPRRDGRHRARPRAGGVRVLRGQARDHPRRDLALRAPQDRRERGPSLLRHRRALRCHDGPPDRPRARGRRPISMRLWQAVLGELRTAGPRAARHAKRLVLDRPDGPETARRIAERRASDEGQAGLGAFIERRRPPWAPPLEPDA